MNKKKLIILIIILIIGISAIIQILLPKREIKREIKVINKSFDYHLESIEISKKGKIAVGEQDSGMVYIFDESLNLIKTLEGDNGHSIEMDFLDEETLFVANSKGTIIKFNLTDNSKEEFRIGNYAEYVDVSSDKYYLAVSEYKYGFAKVYTIENMSELIKLNSTGGSLMAGFSEKDRYLAVGTLYGNISIYDTDFWDMKFTYGNYETATLITSLCWGGGYLFFGGEEPRNIMVLSKGNWINVANISDGRQMACEVSHNKKLISLTNYDKNQGEIYELEGFKLKYIFEIPTNPKDTAFSPDDKKIYYVGLDGFMGVGDL